MSDCDYRVSCDAECNAVNFDDLKFLLRRQSAINLAVHIISYKINDDFTYNVQEDVVNRAVDAANKIIEAVEKASEAYESK